MFNFLAARCDLVSAEIEIGTCLLSNLNSAKVCDRIVTNAHMKTKPGCLPVWSGVVYFEQKDTELESLGSHRFEPFFLNENKMSRVEVL